MKKLSRYILFFILLSIITSCTPPSHLIRKKIYYTNNNEKRKNIIKTAEKYIGVKYKNGGENEFGFDCSGFTMFIYNKNGINIPRKASSQYYAGTKLKLKKAKPGDLVFFRTNGFRISHVGIYLGNFKFIHSPATGKKISYANIKNPYWGNRYVGSITFFKF